MDNNPSSGLPFSRVLEQIYENSEPANGNSARSRTGTSDSSNVGIENRLKVPSEEQMDKDVEEKSAAFYQEINYLNELCKTVKETEVTDVTVAEDLIKKVFWYLLSDYQCLRAVTIRILRLLCVNERTLVLLLRLQVDFFLARSLDLNAENVEERIEALKLCAVMLHMYNRSELKAQLNLKLDSRDSVEKNDSFTLFPKSIILPVFLIAKPAFCEQDEEYSHRKLDRLALPCFAVFLETAINEPLLVIEAAGTGWIVDALMMPNNKWVSPLVCRMLCLWLDHPRLRTEAKLNTVLEQIFAPLIEIGFFQAATIGEMKVTEERIQDILDGCFETFLNLLLTWSGLYSCASSDRYGKTVVASPFRLLEFLGCGTVVSKNLRKIRDIVVNVCCELVNCPYASTTFETWFDAMQCYASKDTPDSYKCTLREDFILAEHEFALARSEQFCDRVDLLKSFRTITLFFLINAGILQSLIRLILADPEDPMSLKATLLLNDLIYMGSSTMPLEWRLRVLSVPTLVQSVCETFTTSTSVDAVDGTYTGGLEKAPENYTFLNAGSGPLLLYRLDVLNNIALAMHAQSSCTGNMPIFVQSARMKRGRSSSLSKNYTNKREEHSDVDTLIHSQIGSAFDSEGKPCWVMIDSILQLLELDERAGLLRHKHHDRFFSFFSQMFRYFSPSSGQFIILSDNDRFAVAIFSRCLCLVISLCAGEAHFEELVTGFLADFVDLISPEKLSTGIFSSTNLLNSNAMYYFAFIGAISSEKYGRVLLEKLNVLQTLVDIVTSTKCAEYVKLIICSLDYSSDDSFTRLVLQTAVTSTSELGRRWSTRFLGVLAEKDSQSFTEWGIHLLLGQLADPSAKVVRHAIRLLTQWLPVYPECLPLLQKLRLDSFGEAGVILHTFLFADEKYVIENPKDVRSAFELWKKEFNMKYVDMVEDDMKIALVNVKRSLDGYFARTSSERSGNCGVFLPVHLYGQLALHESGREWLTQSKEVDRLLSVLRDVPANMSYSEIRQVKAAIFALAHVVTSLDMGWADIMAAETITIMCRYAEACPVLSVRGVAFWALNLIGGCEYGARFLASLGWESSRYSGIGEKEQIGEWEIPHVDPAKLWINCLDVCTSDPHYIVKKDLNQSTSLSRTDRSSTAASISSSRQVNDVVERKDTVRSIRSYTNDSAETSGLGSTYAYESDAASALFSDFDFGVPNVPQRHIGDESVPDTFSDSNKLSKLHHSSVIRARLGLPSFEFGNTVAVERFLEVPICYPYMPNSELRSFRKFRCLYPSSLEAPVDDLSPRLMHSERPFVVLPCVSELTTKNIFAEEPYISLVDDQLRSKVEDPEDLRKALLERRSHRSDRCFFCSSPANCFDGKVPPVSSVDPQERNILLSLIEMRYSKDSLQKSHEKKIFSRREQNAELFSSPCLYWDAFEIISGSRYRIETRRLIHDLFTDALNLLSSHFPKM